MTCIKVMEMCMVLCSFVTIVLCIRDIDYVLNFLYMCTCIYWIMYWYTCFCIVCVVYWFTQNCWVMWFEFVNFLSIDCSMYLGLYCNFCGVLADILLYWLYMYMAMYYCAVYRFTLLCVIASYMYIGALLCILCIMCFGYILLYTDVYFFVSPTCSSDGGSGAGTFLCLSPSSRSAYGISSFKAPNNPGPFWYKKIESHYCAVDSWHIYHSYS